MKSASNYLAEHGKNLLIDYYVTHVGDDLELIMTHNQVSIVAKSTNWHGTLFMEATEVARQLKYMGQAKILLEDSSPKHKRLGSSE